MKMLHRQKTAASRTSGVPPELQLKPASGFSSQVELKFGESRSDPIMIPIQKKMISKNEHRVSNGGFFVLGCFQNFKSRSTAATVQMDKTTRKYVQLHLWDEYKFAFTLHLGNGMPCKSSRKKLFQ
jgi:hypothetical protein